MLGGISGVKQVATRPSYVKLQIPLVNFAVVANCLDGIGGPGVVEADVLAEVAFDTQQTADARVCGVGHHVTGISSGDAHFLGVHQSEVGPLDNVEPCVVALTDNRTQRLFGNDLRQNHVLVGVLQLETLGRSEIARCGPGRSNAARECFTWGDRPQFL